MDPTLQAAFSLLPQPYATYAATLVAIYLAVCTVCSAIDREIPQPGPGSFWVPVRRMVSMLALNGKYAANAVPAGAVPAPVLAHVAELQAAAETVTMAAGTLSRTIEGQLEAVPSPVVGPAATPVVPPPTGGPGRAVGLLLALGVGMLLAACSAAQLGQAADVSCAAHRGDEAPR